MFLYSAPTNLHPWKMEAEYITVLFRKMTFWPVDINSCWSFSSNQILLSLMICFLLVINAFVESSSLGWRTALSVESILFFRICWLLSIFPVNRNGRFKFSVYLITGDKIFLILFSPEITFYQYYIFHPNETIENKAFWQWHVILVIIEKIVPVLHDISGNSNPSRNYFDKYCHLSMFYESTWLIRSECNWLYSGKE